MASYNRKRKDQYFEKPSGIKKYKTHSPDFTNVTWDKDDVLKDLQKQQPMIKNWYGPNLLMNTGFLAVTEDKY